MEQSLNYSFDKDKLPNGFFYPLKRSILNESLGHKQIQTIYAVYYSLGKLNYPYKPLMSADYCGESYKEMFAAGRASITVYAIRSTGKIEINKNIILKALDTLTDWVVKLEQSESVYRAVNHSVNIYWNDGEIIVEKN